MRYSTILALVFVATVGTSSALVDAKRRTTITVKATGCDEWAYCRCSGLVCQYSYSCCPEDTQDGDLTTRWSCKGDLENGPCKLTYLFSEPQDIVQMRVAFHKGDENRRRLRVSLNGDTYSTIESSGETLGYQTFYVNSDETEELSLEAVNLDSDEWISITEVEFWVD